MLSIVRIRGAQQRVNCPGLLSGVAGQRSSLGHEGLLGGAHFRPHLPFLRTTGQTNAVSDLGSRDPVGHLSDNCGRSPELPDNDVITSNEQVLCVLEIRISGAIRQEPVYTDCQHLHATHLLDESLFPTISRTRTPLAKPKAQNTPSTCVYNISRSLSTSQQVLPASLSFRAFKNAVVHETHSEVRSEA
ncbi:hypothetical protein F503_00141 [Ophiostoma piceae UAMH 11346]|uniref:Uncharacterized protein n=1 Tax=Ophiostoma piceae (strain UAMH 11346) TaxID=1262450 RepID=S3BWR9_OPHP1|nr:hypothetical protein F503_00141 [Ophiostoma piceae UAMH 11346]